MATISYCSGGQRSLDWDDPTLVCYPKPTRIYMYIYIYVHICTYMYIYVHMYMHSNFNHNSIITNIVTVDETANTVQWYV